MDDMATQKRKYNEYMNDYMKRRYASRRQEAINRLGGICLNCESTDDLYIIHYKPNKKVIKFRTAYVWNKEKFLEWLDDCILFCPEHFRQHKAHRREFR